MAIDEFRLEFIPLDEDVLSLEMPHFFKDYFLVCTVLSHLKSRCFCCGGGRVSLDVVCVYMCVCVSE